jgi:F0F1-type ATP synthase epsilon subunit
MAGESARLGVGWADGRRILRYAGIMATHVDEMEKLEADPGGVEHGYDSWKRAKIERGLIQAQDRSAMIPVEQVLRDLTIDR